MKKAVQCMRITEEQHKPYQRGGYSGSTQVHNQAYFVKTLSTQQENTKNYVSKMLLPKSQPRC